MKIFIDGDACSARKIKRKFAHQQGTEVVTVVSIENCQHFQRNKNTIVVDAAPQATDIEIFNQMQQGDMVITKDYGLASLALGKHGKAMSPNGFVYTKKNIGLLLQQRYVNGVLRSSSIRKKKKNFNHLTAPSL